MDLILLLMQLKKGMRKSNRAHFTVSLMQNLKTSNLGYYD